MACRSSSLKIWQKSLNQLKPLGSKLHAKFHIPILELTGKLFYNYCINFIKSFKVYYNFLNLVFTFESDNKILKPIQITLSKWNHTGHNLVPTYSKLQFKLNNYFCLMHSLMKGFFKKLFSLSDCSLFLYWIW